MFNVCVWINTAERWMPVYGIEPQSTANEASVIARERSALKTGHVYAVVEREQKIPCAICYGGSEFPAQQFKLPVNGAGSERVILYIHDGLNQRGYPYDDFGVAIDRARNTGRTAWMWWSIVRLCDNVVLARG